MSQKYKQNLADTSDQDYKNNPTIDQKLWLKFQRNTCKNIECLIREYKEYIGKKTYRDWNNELSSSDLPDKSTFGDFSQTVGISTYNPDIEGWNDAQDITNTISIYSVAKKPYLSVIEGKTQLLLKDIDYQFSSGRCGVRGYFDGIVLNQI